MHFNPEELARYSRHLNLSELGTGGQEKLKAARVLIVGIGGLGSPASLYLAAAGVGTLGLIDFDNVDLSNLQRQVLFNTSQVGTNKVVAARAQLLALNPHIDIRIHACRLSASNIIQVLQEYDLILDGTDQFDTRYLLNDACVRSAKPFISAAIHRFEGQLFTYVPQHSPCYRCLFPSAPEIGQLTNCADAGVLGVVPGVIGTLQATEAIKFIIQRGDLLCGRLLTYHALDMRFAEFHFSKRLDCIACGTEPCITLSDTVTYLSTPASADSISVTELQQLLTMADDTTLLIDVREPAEFAAGHIQCAVNLPINTLSADLLNQKKYSTLVFICRSGMRSAQACAWAKNHSAAKTVHTHGGMLAWCRTIDPSIAIH